MQTFDAINKRCSTRHFKPDPVEKELLEMIIDSGRRAPTARGIEPWEFIVVTQRKTLVDLGKIADHGSFIAESTACIIVLCENTKYYLEDGCSATENILIACADLGLGSCWVAGDKKDYSERVKAAVSAPEALKLVSLIAVGWPEGDPLQYKKRNLREVLHWERY